LVSVPDQMWKRMIILEPKMEQKEVEPEPEPEPQKETKLTPEFKPEPVQEVKLYGKKEFDKLNENDADTGIGSNGKAPKRSTPAGGKPGVLAEAEKKHGRPKKV